MRYSAVLAVTLCLLVSFVSADDDKRYSPQFRRLQTGAEAGVETQTTQEDVPDNYVEPNVLPSIPQPPGRICLARFCQTH